MPSNLELPEGVSISHISICTYTNELDEEEMADRFESLKDIKAPERFTTEIRDVKQDDFKDTSIIFSEEAPSKMDPESNILFINVDQERGGKEECIHIHADLDLDACKDSIASVEDILEIVGEVEVVEFNISFTVNHEFSSLNLPIDEGDIEVIGVRLHISDADYIIQEDDSETIIYYNLQDSFTTSGSNFIPERVAEATENIQSFRDEI